MSQNKKIWPVRAAAILFCLVMATTYALSGMYARFATTAGASDQARTAAFIFEVDEDVFLNLDEIRKPGDTKTVNLKLSNSNGAVSEVSQDYVLTITEEGSLPLTYTLDGVTIQEKAEKTRTLQAAVEQNVPYTLVVTWPADQNNPIYASGAATVRLNITAEQIN